MSIDRRFRFAVLASEVSSAPSWREQARTAEDLGYGGLLVPDHLGREWGPLVSLATAAEATGRIALGTLMLATDLRHPLVLFKELATLAQFAGDRLEIGLGAGWLAQDYERAGIPMAPAGERIDRLAEATTILKALWRGGPLDHRGTHYTLTGAVGEPAPPPAAAVKWVLGGGGRRMLAVAAEHADIINVSAQVSAAQRGPSFFASARLADFDRRHDWIRSRAQGRFDDIEIQCLAQVCAVTADRDRYGQRVLARAFGMDAADALDSPLALVGTADEICDRLERLRDRLGMSYWVLPAAQLKPFADVVERLTGK
ncbi:TIGR03621 family F420-dependent LLM class oxidoreductase [Dactylosporangium sp. CA-052675]|uniref:TIGR03621 family F420-dependent LLM class oxidoreductase n=1 Tax=Dactylosporangium sp. CA-052675 TaxID=3239927 RepID=UPI003D8DAC7A